MTRREALRIIGLGTLNIATATGSAAVILPLTPILPIMRTEMEFKDSLTITSPSMGVSLRSPKSWNRGIVETNDTILIPSPELRNDAKQTPRALFMIRETDIHVDNSSSLRKYAKGLVDELYRFYFHDSGSVQISMSENPFSFQRHDAFGINLNVPPQPGIPNGLIGRRIVVAPQGMILNIGYNCERAVASYTQPILEKMLDSVQFSKAPRTVGKS